MKNPAKIIYTFVLSIDKNSRNTSTMIEAYKTIFGVNNIFQVYERLHIIDNQIALLEKILENSGKLQNYKNMIRDTKNLVHMVNLTQSPQGIKQIISNIKPLYMVLADALWDSVDVKEDIDSVIKDIDDFIKSVKASSSLKSKEKIIIVKVTNNLKEALELYQIGGYDRLIEALKTFECFTKDDKKASSIYKKIEAFMDKASKVKSGIETLEYFKTALISLSL